MILRILPFVFMLGIPLLLTGCTSSAQSQLKESVCKDCLDKTPFYRNGEWLS